MIEKKQLTTEQIEQALQAEFTTKLADNSTVPDVHWRLLHKFEKKIAGKDVPFAEFIAYIKAPQIAARLNEVVGTFNWEDVYEEMRSDKGMVCTLTVNGVSKSGIGTCHGAYKDVDFDKTKESDSMKRAAIKFGIGAYLKEVTPIELATTNKKGAWTTDNPPRELKTNDEITAYLNQVNPDLLAFTEIIKKHDKPTLTKIKSEIEAVWKLIKGS